MRELLARGSVWREHTTHSRGIPVSAAKRLPAALHAEVVSLRSRIIPAVVQQHVGDAIHLHGTRTLLAEAPHVTLAHLRRFDDRLAAHLAGLAVAGEHAISVCTAALDAAIPSSMFVAAVRALEDGRREWFTRLLAMSMGVEPFRTGFSSALGWLGPTHLRGIVADILGSPHAIARCLGVAACAIHRVDPGLVSANLLLDEDAAVRAGPFGRRETGRRELVSMCGAAATSDKDPLCNFWAAWSAVLLGDRERALDVLASTALGDAPYAARSCQIALLAMAPHAAHALLKKLATDSGNRRRLLFGTAMAGDPAYVPWLIVQMEDEVFGRLAGEAFSFITGADLAWLDLERKPPEGLETGPNDDPSDPDVDMDPDDGLPWPDADRVQSWWAQNGARFTAGTRYFVGAPVTRDHCLHVLKTGYQRQRIAAAFHRCLLEPGTPLFEWRAPAWRQECALAALGAAG